MANQDVHTGSGSPFQTQVTEPEVWQRVIKVEVSRAYFDQEYARRLHRAAKDHVRPGFRKGKAPKAVVERELGDQLRAQTLEHVVPQAFKAAIVEHDLVPITDPVVENLVFEPDKPLSFDMTIEVRPKIVARDFEGLPITRREAKVNDSDVDDVLERLRQSRAVFEKIDRAAQKGDWVLLDLTPVGEDGEPDTAKTAKDQRLELGSENNFPAFNEQITGAEAGDRRRIEITYPDDHTNAELKGKTVVFDCLVQQVEQKALPELDDAFAAGLQEGKTLLDIRLSIREDLLKEEEARIDREMDEQIVDLLIERNDLAVPPSLVEQYLKSGLEELHGRNAQMSRPVSEEEDERYREVTRPVAERILKGMFIMEAIRRQESLEVTDEEVAERIDQIARENNFDPEKYREWVAQGSERDRILHGLEERKTFDFLLSRAEMKESEAAGE